jgi:cobalt-precorrin 5A hydrolase/precorrin-3B C17-methyltransferase
VVGLGPGGREYLLPLVRDELERATDLIGYQTYLALAGPFRPEQRVHGSDNREEMARARHALQLAAAGRRVVVVSSGDPGILVLLVHPLRHIPTAMENSPDVDMVVPLQVEDPVGVAFKRP